MVSGNGVSHIRIESNPVVDVLLLDQAGGRAAVRAPTSGPKCEVGAGVGGLQEITRGAALLPIHPQFGSHQLAYGYKGSASSPSAGAQTTPTVVVDVRRH